MVKLERMKLESGRGVSVEELSTWRRSQGIPVEAGNWKLNKLAEQLSASRHSTSLDSAGGSKLGKV